MRITRGWWAVRVVAAAVCVASTASGRETSTATGATTTTTAATAAAAAVPATTELNDLAAGAARAAMEKFSGEKLQEKEFAVTVIDLRDADAPKSGSFRGDVPFFPASVVKLFYLNATHRWLQDGNLADTPELRRTMHDMIVDSSNDATAAIVDALTDTGNGAPLSDDQMKQWAQKRNAMNRYYAALGFPVGGGHGINVCQKTYCEGPYGRERLFLGQHYENRNQLTTDATARLLCQIVRGEAVSAERSKEMMELLHRDPSAKSEGADDQNHDFTARALPPGWKLWAKAGWTSTARHDAAYVESDDGALKVIVVTFTSGHAKQRDIIPTIARSVFGSLRQARPK